jgi:hypothetical protein
MAALFHRAIDCRTSAGFPLGSCPARDAPTGVETPFAIGYCDGANIAAAVFLTRPAALIGQSFSVDGYLARPKVWSSGISVLTLPKPLTGSPRPARAQ